MIKGQSVGIMHPKQLHGELRRTIKRVQSIDDVTHRTPFDKLRVTLMPFDVISAFGVLKKMENYL